MTKEPKDYVEVDDVPESSGTLIDKFFWVLYPWLPSWLHGDSKLAHLIIDQVFIDCMWCLFMRGVFFGGLIGLATGLVFGLLF